MKVRYTPQARGDLDEIFKWLNERSPGGARAVKARIVAAINRLADFPLMAAETDEPDVRELAIVSYPYSVYYQVAGQEVWILHIRHSSREPWV